MRFKRTFLLICLFVCLFAMASVCASDANDTAIAIENSLEMDHTTDDLIGVDKDAEMVWKRLQEYNGVLPFNDKADPEIIKKEFILQFFYLPIIGRIFTHVLKHYLSTQLSENISHFWRYEPQYFLFYTAFKIFFCSSLISIFHYFSFSYFKF